MCERRVDVLRLAGNLVLFLFWLCLECTHVVQSVGNLDEYYAYVVAHREQQFAEVLSLLGCFVAEHSAGDLCQSVHYLCNLRAEQVVDVLHRIIGILHHVVQQCSADGGAAQSDLAHHDLCHGERVHDIRLTAKPAHAVVRLVGKAERLLDALNVLAVRCMCVRVD